MTSRVQTLRSSTKKARPSGRAVGELYVNFADEQIGVVGPSGNIDLLAVRNFSATTDYVAGDLVVNLGVIYRATGPISAGAWNAAQWADLNTNLTDAIRAFSATATYALKDIVSYDGKIYVCTTAITVGAAWDATKWTKIADAAQTFTVGSIPFAGTGGALTEDNANLFWDDTNNRLGVGTKTPRAPVTIDEANVPYVGQLSIDIASNDYGHISFNDKTSAAADKRLGYLLAYNGTPKSFTFASNYNFYIDASSANSAAVIFGNTSSEKARFTPTGQLGIGVVPAATDPLLTVNSDAKINGVTVGKGAGSAAGNVAVGDSALAANNGGSQCTAIGSLALSTQVTGSFNVALGQGSMRLSNGATNCLAIGTASLVRVTGDKNIGLGYGAGDQITTGSGNVVIGSAPGTAAMTNTVIIADGAGGEKCRFTASGEMLVGLISAATLATSGGIYLAPTGSSGGHHAYVENTKGGTPLALGRVGDGPAINIMRSGVHVANLILTGTTPSFAAVSDKRLKENIVDLPSQLDAIMSMRPVEFDWKDGSGHQIGFIAQEFEKVYPDCVTEREDGIKQIAHWNKNEARLVSALQEAVKKIEDLEARLAKLENK